MNALLQRPKKLKLPCDQIGEEDGVDPRRYFDRRRHGRPRRKVMQLCAQVAEALAYAIGEDGDERVQALTVLRVLPFPDSSRVLVEAGFTGWVDAIEVERSLASLHAANSRLREKVAASIHRKKTPKLSFRVVPMRQEWEERE